MKLLTVVNRQGMVAGKTTSYFLVAILMMAAVTVHTYRFSGRNFREDELLTIHAAKTQDVYKIAEWTAVEGFHPLGWTLGATIWVDVFGDSEPVVRYLSTLFTLLALAFVYRLGADLFDWQVGLLAALFLGALPFFQFYGHELRPYSALVAFTAGMQLMFLRWLRHHNFRHALLYVLCGIAALQSHLFALYVIVAQVILFCIFVRWDRALYLRAFGLFASIGISFLPWMLAVLHGSLVTNEGGIKYALTSDLVGFINLNRNIQGMLIFLLPALFIPVGMIYPMYRAYPSVQRFNPEWRRWNLVGVALVILVLTFGINTVTRNLTARNLMIMMPSLVVLAGYCLRAMYLRGRLVLVALIAGMGLFVFQPYSPDIPYRQMTAFISEDYEDGDLFVTNINHNLIGVTGLTYYLLDWLPGNVTKDDFFHIVEPDMRATFFVEPDPVINVVRDDSPETLARFRAFLAAGERVFYVHYYGEPLYNFTPLTGSFAAILEELYVPVRTQTFITPFPESIDTDYYTITEYRRSAGGGD